ncbi:MAG: transposase [Deltaproteobacteria bacterium]|nr:transposase [Deltaproteobacteria bacterium]
MELSMREGNFFQPRKPLRLSGFDYGQTGAYFITICTADRENLFGHIIDGQMQENKIGKTVHVLWHDLNNRFNSIETDAFVVMPNHVHGIIIVGAQFIAPSKGLMNQAPTLGDIVRTFKAVSSREIRTSLLSRFAWQRNYYEHVIRDDKSLNRIREYIVTNPLRWELDRENPSAQGNDDFDIWLDGFKKKRNLQSGITKANKIRP